MLANAFVAMHSKLRQFHRTVLYDSFVGQFCRTVLQDSYVLFAVILFLYFNELLCKVDT